MRNARFEWDDEKARSNAQKHGVSFEEGTTIFGPARAQFGFDREHSAVEDRFMMIGYSSRGRLIAVWHTYRDERVRIIGAASPRPQNGKRMKRSSSPDDDEMPAEFDFSNSIPNPYFVAMHGAKYVRVIDKDLADAFPDDESVNAALRAIAEVGARLAPQNQKRSARTAAAPKSSAKKKGRS